MIQHRLTKLFSSIELKTFFFRKNGIIEQMNKHIHSILCFTKNLYTQLNQHTHTHRGPVSAFSSFTHFKAQEILAYLILSAVA